MKNKSLKRRNITKLTMACATLLGAQSAFSQDTYFIEHKPTGYRFESCSEVDGTAVLAGSATTESTCAQWLQVPATDGFFHIRNAETGKNVRPDTAEDGSPIVVQPASWRGNWTQWSHQDTGDGFGYLVNRATGKHVFIAAGNEGTELQQQPASWRGDYTRWAFTDTQPVNSEQVTLIDAEGDTQETEVVFTSGKFEDIANFDISSATVTSNAGRSVASFQLTQSLSSVPGEFDAVSSDSIDNIRIALEVRGNVGFDYYAAGTLINPLKNTNSFIQWAVEGDSLFIYEYEKAPLIDLDSGLPIMFYGEPSVYEIRGITGSAGDQVYINYSDKVNGAERAYVASLKGIENTLIELDPAYFDGLVFPFYISGKGDSDFYPTQFVPETETAGLWGSAAASRTYVSEDIFGNVAYRAGIEPADFLKYSINDGVVQLEVDVINGFGGNENTYLRYYGLQAYEGHNAYEYCLALFLAPGEDSEIYQQESAKAKEYCQTKDILGGLNQSLFVKNESQALAIAFDGEFNPEINQGEAQDADGDGVSDAVDGDPLDPFETLDSDGDGRGDNDVVETFGFETLSFVDLNGDETESKGYSLVNRFSETEFSELGGVYGVTKAFSVPVHESVVSGEYDVQPIPGQKITYEFKSIVDAQGGEHRIGFAIWSDENTGESRWEFFDWVFNGEYQIRLDFYEGYQRDTELQVDVPVGELVKQTTIRAIDSHESSAVHLQNDYLLDGRSESFFTWTSDVDNEIVEFDQSNTAGIWFGVLLDQTRTYSDVWAHDLTDDGRAYMLNNFKVDPSEGLYPDALYRVVDEPLENYFSYEYIDGALVFNYFNSGGYYANYATVYIPELDGYEQCGAAFVAHDEETLSAELAKLRDFCETKAAHVGTHYSLWIPDTAASREVIFDGIFIPGSTPGLSGDADNDGVVDGFDGDPFDPFETQDTDGDGIGYHTDPAGAVKVVTLIDSQGDELDTSITTTDQLLNTLAPIQSQEVQRGSFVIPLNRGTQLGVYDSEEAGSLRFELSSFYFEGSAKNGWVLNSEGTQDYLEWEWVDNTLELNHFHEGFEVAETGQRIGVGLPNFYRITSIVGSKDDVVLIEMSLTDGSEEIADQAYITNIGKVKNEFLDWDPAVFEGKVFYMLLDNRGEVQVFTNEITQVTGTTGTEVRLGEVNGMLTNVSEGVFPNAEHRREVQSSAPNITYSFEGKALIEEYEYPEFSFVGRVASYLLSYDETSGVYEICSSGFTVSETLTYAEALAGAEEYCTSEYIYAGAYRELLAFDESQMLAISWDGKFIPGTNQGAEMDADKDGVLDLEDGAPLDPTETLDSDGDGIGDNRDTD